MPSSPLPTVLPHTTVPSKTIGGTQMARQAGGLSDSGEASSFRASMQEMSKSRNDAPDQPAGKTASHARSNDVESIDNTLPGAAQNERPMTLARRGESQVAEHLGVQAKQIGVAEETTDSSTELPAYVWTTELSALEQWRLPSTPVPGGESLMSARENSAIAGFTSEIALPDDAAFADAVEVVQEFLPADVRVYDVSGQADTSRFFGSSVGVAFGFPGKGSASLTAAYPMPETLHSGVATGTQQSVDFEMASSKAGPHFLQLTAGAADPSVGVLDSELGAGATAKESLLFTKSGFQTMVEQIVGSEKGDIKSGPLPAAASSALLSTQANGLASAQAPSTPVSQMSVPVNIAFGHPQWSNTMAERAAWLVSQNIQSADIQLDPPELGPLQIKVQVQNDQAVVSFVSANPSVRDAIDQSLARLRELLNEQGIQLADSDVSDHSHGNGEGQSNGADHSVGPDGGPEVSSDGEPSVNRMTIASGIDYFV